MNNKMKNSFRDLLIQYNGDWKVKDFKKYITQFEIENKIILSPSKGYNQQKISWVYFPKTLKKLLKNSYCAFCGKKNCNNECKKVLGREQK